MQYSLPYGNSKQVVSIPKSCSVEFISSLSTQIPPDSEVLIENAFSNPLNSATISEITHLGDSVVIVVDDHTRHRSVECDAAVHGTVQRRLDRKFFGGRSGRGRCLPGDSYSCRSGYSCPSRLAIRQNRRLPHAIHQGAICRCSLSGNLPLGRLSPTWAGPDLAECRYR